MEKTNLVHEALGALRSEPRIGPHFKPDLLRLEPDGAILIEAEMETVAQKRIALERLAALAGTNGIVDRLRVKPSAAMSDDGILDHLRKALLQEPMFEGMSLLVRNVNELTAIREVSDAIGQIEFEVEAGIVTLNGSVPGLTSKRLAGVLAWWIPGIRDVVNGIAAQEEDAPILIEEAVRVALEKDRLVDASQLRVGVRGRVVRLTGLVKSDLVRKVAEADAWYVFGVDDVVNEIAVRP